MRLLLACDSAAKPPIDLLQRSGVVCDVQAGLRLASRTGTAGYDLVLLAAATGGAALPAVAAMRRDGRALPTMVLAGTLAEGDEEALLDAGADEVLPETITPARLLARLRAAVRRQPGQPGVGLPACGNLRLDAARRSFEVDGRHLPLTGSEYDLLAELVARGGKLVGKAACRQAIYRDGEPPGSRTLDVFVCRLRRKLATAGAGAEIRTVWSRGYVLDRRAA